MNIKLQITTQDNMDFYKCTKNAIIEVDFEQYVATVVMSEIGTQTLEAAKAQAIAARTYAIFHGALDGKVISDSSATFQAYKAQRYVSGLYPVCIQGTQETFGQILIYNDKPINAVYCDSNGGRTYSSKEVWGGFKDYLVAQTDPWDAAAGKAKHSHGVGMSQAGCKWAAKHGASYKNILAFYYPKTKITTYYYKVKKSLLEDIKTAVKTAIEEL